MTKPELLAPAGDFECLQAAANFGADAVYIGGDLLQLRSGKVGFSREDIRRAAEYLHARGKKLYVTVNCFAYNDEIAACAEYARFLQDAGVDAAIISDMGVMAEFAAAAPQLELHVSTQANCMNYRTAEMWAKLGAKRVVLARELSLADIRALREKLDPSIELEAFVHGAMCMSYSGRCLISSYLNARSGNRGECTQPCRWSYTLMEEKRPGEYFPIEEDEGGTAILSSHDLCCIELLDEIAAAGICSFKIEGRMKSAYYVAAVV
ncbi:MAG: U32 family peptidase, partial [Oscillospiraceae bacterium]|nr:U32 family peptidase [Oscillospiraceae bacterium]